MSSSGDISSRTQRLFERASQETRLLGVIFTGLSAVLFAIADGAAGIALTIGDLFIRPGQAFAGSIASFIEGLFGGAGTILNVGAITTALSIGPDGLFNVGPATFALAIVSVAAGYYVIALYLARDDTGNVFFGLPIDLPTPGFEDPEEGTEGDD